jgi:chorismate-pyruvate lyase
VSRSTPSTADLETLVGLFYRDSGQLGAFSPCQAAELPAAYRRLLAHKGHMTVTVERRHASPVDVEVLRTMKMPTHYSREILLRRQSDGRVVQYGIVRLALAAIEEPARSEILSEQIPLGRVLIKYNVLRAVQLLGLWQVGCGQELAQQFGVRAGHTTFGRTALIYCNSEPAVELLEIVAPEDTFEP